MYGMPNSGKLFSDELTYWLIYEAGFNQSKYKISVYYKYARDVSKLVVLSYVDDYVYWYTSEKLGNLFVDTLEQKIPCELTRICTLVYVNQDITT